jgi:hypothetical protein
MPPALRMIWASPVFNPAKLFDRKSRVHASNNREAARRRHGQITELETADIFLICLKYFVRCTHVSSFNLGHGQ